MNGPVVAGLAVKAGAAIAALQAACTEVVFGLAVLVGMAGPGYLQTVAGLAVHAAVRRQAAEA